MKIGRSKAQKFALSLRYSEEGLVPVAVVSADNGNLLTLAYADREAAVRTLEAGFAWFYSRSRKKLWRKGETSGNTMRVISVGVDCDNDALLYAVEVKGKGNACHLNRKSCFVEKFGRETQKFTLKDLAGIIEERLESKASGSYTAKLAASKKLACAKIEEESAELVEALQKKNRKEVIWEACDLIYHALVAARGRGVTLADLEGEFARRRK